MNSKPADFKINFIVYSQFPQYMDYIGSPIVCHSLANNLKTLGENSYIYANQTHPKFSTTCIPWGTDIIYDEENTVLVMPAGAGEHTFEYLIPDNIRSIPNVVRLMVNHQVKPYPPSDKVYELFPYFSTLSNTNIDGKLPNLYIDLEVFYDRGLPREGSCYLVKGGHDDNWGLETEKYHTVDDLCLDNYWAYDGDRMEYLAEVFNKKESFVTYNAQTGMSILAALCGCRSIVIPKPSIKKEHWLAKFESMKYGIAFGVEDMQRAEETLHLLRPHIEHQLNMYLDRQQIFIDDCYTWMRDKYKL